LFNNDVKQGNAMFQLEVLVHQVDRILKAGVFDLEEGCEVVVEALVRKAVVLSIRRVQRLGGVLDPNVNKVE
jgi:hypothetical protein